MTRLLRYQKTLFVLHLTLILLVIASVSSHAYIVCREADNFAHLEYNLAGACEVFCLPAPEPLQVCGQTPPAAALRMVDEGCLDSTLVFGHAPPPHHRPFQGPPATDAGPPVASFPNSTPTLLAQRQLNRLAQPPPLQPLALLRTIVLLI